MCHVKHIKMCTLVPMHTNCRINTTLCTFYCPKAPCENDYHICPQIMATIYPCVAVVDLLATHVHYKDWYKMSLITYFLSDDVRLFFWLGAKKIKNKKSLELVASMGDFFENFCTIQVAANSTNLTHILKLFYKDTTAQSLLAKTPKLWNENLNFKWPLSASGHKKLVIQ